MESHNKWELVMDEFGRSWRHVVIVEDEGLTSVYEDGELTGEYRDGMAMVIDEVEK